MALWTLIPAHVIANISRGGSRKFRKGWLEHLPAVLDTFYFSENSIKIIQNFKEKCGDHGPLGPPLNPPAIRRH